MWNSFPGKIIMTLLISMTPVVELRGAIPVAVANGLPLWLSLAVSCVGNMLPVPLIIIFTRKFFALLRHWFPWLDGLVTRLENRIARKSDVVLKYSTWGLVILVAIPLPGTGAWTGAMIAAMLDLRMKRALPAILLGVLIAGFIVALASFGIGFLFA